MPSWLVDPVLRFKVERILRSRDTLGAALALGVLYAFSHLPVFQSISWSTIIGFVALFAAIGAVPTAAYEIATMDRDGRFDQLRLSGRPPARLLTSTFIVSAGVPVAVGLTVFLMWTGGEGLPAGQIAWAIAVLTASVALSVVVLALPRNATRGDARQAILAVGVVTLFLLAVGANVEPLRIPGASDLQRSLPFAEMSAGVLGAAVATVILAWKPALRAATRPAIPRGSAPALLGALRRLAGRHATYRGLVGSVMPAAVILVVTATLSLAVWLSAVLRGWRPRPLLVVISFLPLAAGGLVISLLARMDRARGRLDVLRIGPATATTSIVWLVAGYWAPFIVATFAIQLSVVSGIGAPPSLLAVTLLLFLVAAPLPLMEGWDGSAPAAYILPSVGVLAVLLIEADAARTDGWGNAAVLRILLLSWIPWVCVLRTWRQPDGQPLQGWTGALAAACLTAVAMWPGITAVWPGTTPEGGAELLSMALLLTVGFVIVPGSTSAQDVWPPLAAAVVISALMLLGKPRAPLEWAAPLLAPAMAWWIGVRVQRWLGRVYFRDRSGFAISVSIVYRITATVVVMMITRGLVEYWPELLGGVAGSPERRRGLIFTAVLFGAAVVVEASYQARQRITPWLRARLA